MPQEIIEAQDGVLELARERVDQYFTRAGSELVPLGNDSVELATTVLVFADVLTEQIEAKADEYTPEQLQRGEEAIELLRRTVSTTSESDSEDIFAPRDETVRKPKKSALKNMGKLGISNIGDLENIVDVSISTVGGDLTPKQILMLQRKNVKAAEVEGLLEAFEEAKRTMRSVSSKVRVPALKSTEGLKHIPNILSEIRSQGYDLDEDSGLVAEVIMDYFRSIDE